MIGVYSSTERLRSSGLGNKVIARMQATLLKQCIEGIQETLPENISAEKKLMPVKEALQMIHFPSDMKKLASAQFRFKFEELFYLQLSLLRQKSIRERNARGIIMHKVGDFFNKCYNNIPFELTNAQKRVIREVREDFKSGRQMNRLLQGDVGSGKTMVALLCSLLSADSGYQSCIMAPTEVLANQHYNNSAKLLENTGIKTALLTGSTKAKERREIAEGLTNGTIHLLFGTHALIEESVQFRNLGFAVIDEQHRFGVEQRAKLWSKNSDTLPHVLVMTATPIPRTLAMTLYGDLDVSVIDELPPGRKSIRTIHSTESYRKKIYEFMKEEISKGRQIFIVYPLINESETLDYKNLQEGYENIIREFLHLNM